jgi:hypothetical protein
LEVVIPAAIEYDGATIPVTSLGQNAFHLNDRLKRISFALDSAVAYFADCAIQLCTNLAAIVLPPSLTHLHPSTFRHTPALVSVTAPDSRTFVAVGDVLFAQGGSKLLFCSRARSGSFPIPEAVTSIGEYALHLCRQIDAITFHAVCQVAEIGDGAFSGTAITEFTLPRSVGSFVGDGPNPMAQGGRFPREGFLQECASLSSVIFETNECFVEIPPCAFRGTAIVELTIPRTVLKLATECFAKTLFLKRLDFEEGSLCRTIEADAFLVTTLETLVLPPSVEFIGPSQFFGSGDLANLSFSAPSPNYIVEDGILMTRDKKQILLAVRTLSEVRIPASVQVICANAFCKCDSLRRVSFEEPSSLTLIDACAFYDTPLHSIGVPDSVERIGDNAFGNCSTLRNVVFRPESKLLELGWRVFGLTSIGSFVGPAGLRSIGPLAFVNSKIRSVKLPEGVGVIEQLSFLGCKLLQNVTLTNPRSVKIMKYAFDGLGPEVSIHKGEQTELVGIEDVRCSVDTRIETDDAPCEVYEPAADVRMTWSELVLDHRDRQKIPGVRPRRGTYGTVCKCQHRDTRAISAVKELLPSAAVSTEFTREIEILAKLRHPAVLGIIGFVMPDERDSLPPQIVTEWMPNGSLEDILTNPGDCAMLTNTQKMKIVVGICQGMRYIHLCGGIHRDLKPANILLDKNFEPRIADLGSAKFTNVGATLNNTLALGTPLYMAPEVLTDETYGPGVDVFSFAILDMDHSDSWVANE